MNRKKTKRPANSENEEPEALEVEKEDGESKPAARAHAVLRPTVQAAATLMDINKDFGELSINALVVDLSLQCELASQGDLTRAEAMLTAQAHTLDAIFNGLARRASLNMGQYIGAAETYLRLALKAQSQCRATLETLAEIKNPRSVAFVKQANIAHGPQQVNNSTAGPDGTSRAREAEIQQNKLLEAQDGQRLDSGTTGAAIKANSTMETLESVHRAEDPER